VVGVRVDDGEREVGEVRERTGGAEDVRRRRRGGDVDDARGGYLVIFADGSTRETFVSTVGDGRRRWVRGESVGRDHLRLVDAVRVRLAQNRRGGAAVFGFTTRGEKESRVDEETLPDARLPPPCVFFERGRVRESHLPKLRSRTDLVGVL